MLQRITRGMTAIAVLALLAGVWMTWNAFRESSLTGARAVLTEACAEELRSTVRAIDPSRRPSLVIEEFDYRHATLDQYVGYAELVADRDLGHDAETMLDDVFRRCRGALYVSLDPYDRRFGRLVSVAFEAIREDDIRHLGLRMRDGSFEVSGTTPEMRR